MLMLMAIRWGLACGHKKTETKAYDFDKEEDIYKYDSFIQFNKLGNDMYCTRCQKQKSLLEFKVWVR
jgi:hypothetical protein